MEKQNDNNSVKLYKSILQKAMDGFWLVDKQGQITEVNAAYCQMSGYSEDDLLAMRIADLESDETKNATVEHINEVARTGSGRFESQHRRKDGSKFDVEISAQYHAADNGQFVVFLRDITEIRKAQKKLEESEGKYKALYDNAPISYQSLNEDGTFRDVNPAWLDTLGYKRDEVIGKNYADFLHPDWKKHFEKNFPEFKKRGYVNDVQFKIRHKKGHYVDISFEGCIGYNPDGSFRQTYCVFQDITERKKTEVKLKLSEERFRRLTENAEDVIYRMAIPSGKYEFINPACETIYGYSQKEFYENQKLIKKVIHPDWAEYFTEQWANLLKGIVHTTYEYEIIHKSGERRWLNQRNVLIKNEKGEAIAIEGIVTDVTEEKKAEKTLRQSEVFNRTIVDNSFDCIKILDLEAKLQFMSQGGQKRLEIKNIKNYIGLSWFDFFTTKDRKSAIAAVKKARAGGIGRFTSFIPSESGKPLWWEAIVTTIVDENVKPISILAISRDITEQKIAEDQIHFQANLLEAVEQAVIVTNPDGIINFWNPFAEKLYGWSAHEVIGRHIGEITVPQISQDQAVAIMAQIGNGKSWSGEFLVQNRDGNVFPALVSNTPIVNSKGEITAIIGISTDITKSKKIENSLRESQSFNETLLNTSPDIIYIYDIIESENIYINEGISKILGYSVKEVSEMGNELISSLMHEEDFKIYVNKTIPRYQTAKDGELIEHEYRMKHKNGEWHWLRSKESIFNRNPDDSPKQIFGIVSDISNSKEVQKKLLEEKNKAQQYLEIAEVILLSIDANGMVQLINPKGCEVLGFSEQEIIGKHWYDTFIPERIRKTVKEVADKIFSGEVELAKYFENEILTKSGEEKLIAWHNSVLRDDNGNITGTLSSGEDITERKQAERALFESEERLRLALKSADQGLYDLNVQTGESVVSPEYASMLGYDPATFVETNHNWIERLHPDDLERVRNTYQQYILGEISEYKVEFRQKTKNGLWIWILSMGSIVERDDEGNPLRMLGTHTNISERKKIEDELRESETRLRLAQKAGQVGIWSVDLSTGKQYLSEEAASFHGLSEGTYTREDMFGMVPDEDLPALNHAFEKAIKEGAQFDVEHRIINKKTGKHTWVHARGMATFNSNGTAILLQGTALDVTKRKKDIQELEDNRKRLNTIFNNTNDILLLVECGENDSFKVVATNKSYIDRNNQFGVPFKEKDIIGISIENILTALHLSQDEIAGIIKKYVKVKETKEKLEFTEHLMINNNAYYAEVSYIPILDSSKNCQYILYDSHEITDRKVAEQALRESEEKFRTFSQISPVGIFVTDIEGKTIYWNNKLDEITGMPIEEGKGDGWLESIHPDDRDMVFDEWYKSTESRSTFDLTYRFKNKQGKITWAIGQAVPMQDANGKLTGFVGSVVDITEIKQAESELRESLQREHFQANIVRNSPLAIVIGYPDGRIENCNKAFSDLTGYSMEELKSIKWNDALTPSSWYDIEAKELQKLSVDNNIIRYDKEYIHKSGKTIPVELVVSAKFDDNKNILHYVGFINDITERKQFLKKLQERNEYIESIMDNMPIGLTVTTTNDGDVKYMNRVFEDIYGWPREILTSPDAFFKHVFPGKEVQEEMKSRTMADMQSGDPDRMKWDNLEIVTSKGEERYIFACNIPIIDQNIMISTVQDVTDRKIAQDELEKHRKHLEELVNERTKDLELKISEIERMNKLFVGRELRMKELKGIIRGLEEKLKTP